MKTCGYGDGRSSNGITPADFVDGSTVFAIDCRPDLCSADAAHLIHRGEVYVEIEFEEPVPYPCSALFYTENYGSYEIDLAGQVSIIGATVL